MSSGHRHSRAVGRKRRERSRARSSVSSLVSSDRPDSAELAEKLGHSYRLHQAALRFHEIEITWLPRELALWSEIPVPMERGLRKAW